MSLGLFYRPLVLALTVGLVVTGGASGLWAEGDQPKPDQKSNDGGHLVPLAKFLTVTSPVDDESFGRVRNAAIDLQSQAANENRRAVLVLEIRPGTSPFHQVQGLAKFLTSVEVSRVTKVAWIPETVTGNNVVLALACNEIIMHPDAELGDIGRGKALDKDEQRAILSLVEKRHNSKLSPALAMAMMDPQTVAMRIIRQQGLPGNETTETQVVTVDELKRLLLNKAVVLEQETIKEAGVVGTFSGRQARALDILVVQALESRGDVAELYNLPPESLREELTDPEARRVQRIEINGMIEPVLEAFLERQIRRAVASGVNLIIFEIESPGGYLLTSENLASAIAHLDEENVRTAAYIPKEAISGAAIIALGCDEIYLHPDARIGDAGPIEIGEGGQFEHVPEKVLATLRLTLQGLAEKKNRPAALAMAMADKDLEVFEVTHSKTGRIWYMTDDEIHRSSGEWIKGPLVAESRENSLLTVDGKRAHELKLAERPVEDLDDLKLRLGIPADVELVAAGRTWVDSLVFFLNTGPAMFLLIVVGVVCLYIELHVPSGLLGIISVICFALFFWSRFLGGTAGWLEVVLFLLGLTLIALEVFVIPGFGVFGVSGGLLIFASIVLASQTFGPFGQNTDFLRLSSTVGTLAAAIVAVVVMAMLMSRFLPHIPVFSQMILTPPGLDTAGQAVEPRLRPELTGNASPTAGIEQDVSLVGNRGEAVSVLRPAGKAKIGDDFVDVVSEGPYIAQGSTIEVIEVAGNRVVVRQV